MRGSLGLGFGIAVVFAASVFLLSLFGKQDSWMEQAAKEAAVRCLTKGPCARLEAKGVRLPEKPPLTANSHCASRRHWQALASGHALLATCTDKETYLYHMGHYPNGGQEQWMICAKPDCGQEAVLFAQSH